MFGYDEWKTTPPDEADEVTRCDICGEPLFDGDFITDINGEIWCDDCLNDRLRRML